MGTNRRDRDNVVTWRLAAVALGAVVVSACEPYGESSASVTPFIAEPARNSLTATRPAPSPQATEDRGGLYGTSEGE